MVELEIHKTHADPCVFVKRYDESDFFILLLYVDDMLVVKHDAKMIASLMKSLSKSFAMKHLGSSKTNFGNVYSPIEDEIYVMGVTREICGRCFANF